MTFRGFISRRLFRLASKIDPDMRAEIWGHIREAMVCSLEEMKPGDVSIRIMEIDSPCGERMYVCLADEFDREIMKGENYKWSDQ